MSCFSLLFKMFAPLPFQPIVKSYDYPSMNVFLRSKVTFRKGSGRSLSLTLSPYPGGSKAGRFDRGTLFWVGLFSLLPFSVLWAQKASAVSDSTGTELEEVVVAGSRWSQALNHVPSQIDVVSKKLIAQFQPQTAADLLGMSGKVFIQKSQQGGGSPMIRGFATNRLIYTVDGVRMNTAIFRSGNIQNVINLDPFATDRVEVVFGPASVMYGSDAVGGVMAFSTLQPRFGGQVTGNTDVRFSSANREKTAHTDVSYG
jgi:hemoglobin/transferrin/lactoferrin receptor protein